MKTLRTQLTPSRTIFRADSMKPNRFAWSGSSWTNSYLRRGQSSCFFFFVSSSIFYRRRRHSRRVQTLVEQEVADDFDDAVKGDVAVGVFGDAQQRRCLARERERTTSTSQSRTKEMSVILTWTAVTRKWTPARALLWSAPPPRCAQLSTRTETNSLHTIASSVGQKALASSFKPSGGTERVGRMEIAFSLYIVSERAAELDVGIIKCRRHRFTLGSLSTMRRTPNALKCRQPLRAGGVSEIDGFSLSMTRFQCRRPRSAYTALIRSISNWNVSPPLWESLRSIHYCRFLLGHQ